jgi:hypothetical protein
MSSPDHKNLINVLGGGGGCLNISIQFYDRDTRIKKAQSVVHLNCITTFCLMTTFLPLYI